MNTQEAKNQMTDSARDFAAKSANTLAETTHNIGKQMGSTVSDFSEKAGDVYKQGCDYVKENPVKGVAIAALAGLVAGSILSRRRH